MTTATTTAPQLVSTTETYRHDDGDGWSFWSGSPVGLALIFIILFVCAGVYRRRRQRQMLPSNPPQRNTHRGQRECSTGNGLSGPNGSYVNPVMQVSSHDPPPYNPEVKYGLPPPSYEEATASQIALH